jgi:N-acetylmuramoyl-L-alanine amidase
LAAAVAGALLLPAAVPVEVGMTAQHATAQVVTIVIDPGHDKYANLGYEPIGPGSSTYKLKDGGGTSGVVTGQTEASVNLRIGVRLRDLLKAAGGIKVVMTRHLTCCVSLGNIARARIANRAHAVLFVRIHADGSTDHRRRGTSMLYPATHKGWTDDIDGRSRRAAELVQKRLVEAVGFPNFGLVARGDLTGFNWSNVPAILAEVGFLTNPSEDRALAEFQTVNNAAWGLRNGIVDYLHDRGLR